MAKGKEFISNLKLYSDYLKWDDSLERYETWEEACDKILETHYYKYGDDITPLLDEVRPSLYNKEFLASQRNLQFRGASVLSKNAKIYNCCSTYAYTPDVFGKGFYVLLCGTGLGVSLKQKYVSQLPNLNKRRGEAKEFIIKDSIEGWADSVKVLISSFCKHDSLDSEYFGRPVKFDYSLIRPKGAYITGGFKAPGPDGLKSSIEKIENLINRHLNGDESIPFKSIIVYDIIMHISDAVLSGGIRRSAVNIILDEDDQDMLYAKTGNWRIEHPHRARSNNSVGLIKGQFDKEKFKKFIDFNKGDNDLGFVFMNNEDEMFNPCFTINQRILTEDGWRTFGELLDKNPKILQDKRVQGIVIDGKEEWVLDYKEKGLVSNTATKVVKTGENKDVYKLETVCGREVEATGDHDFATKRGMVKLLELTDNDEILVGLLDKPYTPNKESDDYNNGLIYDFKEKGLKEVHYQPKDFKYGVLIQLNKVYNFDNENLNELSIICETKDKALDILLLLQELGYYSVIENYSNDSYFKVKISENELYAKVKNIEYLRNEDVYCLEENVRRTLIVEGLTARRCYEIGFNFYNKIQNKTFAAFQFCNLDEINASSCVDSKGNFSEAKFYELCRKAAIIGTLQAGYTSFPYLGKQTEDIVKGEALIGVSVTGWMTRPELFNGEILSKGAEIVKETNSEVAKIIKINEAARCTTVKPSGNSATILKTASGIHPEHSKRYFRIMQLNKESETAKWLENNAPSIIEDSKWSANHTDYVVYSPCENSEKTIYKADMKGIKHLELIKLVQNSWVTSGKRIEKCYEPETSHNVSNTVIIDDLDEITNYLYENQKYFTAVSFISAHGDKDYVQAPFTSVLNTQELVETYGDGAILMSGLIVDGLHYFDDDLWDAVSYVQDDSKKLTGDRDQVLLKKDWVRRVKKFSKNYFKGDIVKTIYCMKDVHLWHKWKVVNREFKLVNFSEILTKPTFEDISKYGAISCSGGACEIQ